MTEGIGTRIYGQIFSSKTGEVHAFCTGEEEFRLYSSILKALDAKTILEFRGLDDELSETIYQLADIMENRRKDRQRLLAS